MVVCPLVPEHGNMHPWNKPPRFRYPWWCPNSDHGGNGFFVDEEIISGVQAMSRDLEEVIPAVLSGEMDIDEAARIIARRSNAPEALARTAIETRLRLARRFAETKTSRQTTVYTPRVAGVSSSASRSSVPFVPPEKFMEAMQARGLSKKQAAEAIGRSISRVHELTVTQGGKQHLYDNFVQKLDEFVGGPSGTDAGRSTDGD